MRQVTLLWLWAGTVLAQQGSIQGTAVNRSTGQPMAGVHIRLMSGLFDGGKDVYGAISDQAGRFSIAPMNPGTYLLMPEFPGFVYVQPKSEDSPLPGLQIRAGQKLENYKLEMTPQPVLSGRVVDEYGDPVANVLVAALPAALEDRVVNLFGAKDSNTNDRGEFRIVAAPGKYHLLARVFSGANEPSEIRTDGSSEVAHTATYYPNSSSEERATVIETTAGKEVSGLEIRLARQPNLSISGVVTGMPGGPARATVMMRFGEIAQALYNSRNASAGSDGRFSFPHLSPGFYRLYAIYSSDQTRLQSGTVDIRLDDADHPNVELPLNDGRELTGSLKLEGLPAGKWAVKLDSPDPLNFVAMQGESLSGVVEADGSFKISHVPAGRYKVTIDPLPEDGYIKSVRLDDTTLADAILDLSKGVHGTRLSIVASGGAAQMSGKVLDKNGYAIENSMVMVYLVKDGKPPDNDSMIRAAADGTYAKKGIRPGKYRVVALDVFQYLGKQVPQSAPRVEPFALGEEIEIHEGDKLVKNIKILEKEEADGKKQ